MGAVCDGSVLMVFVLFIEILTHVIAAVFKKRRKG